MGLGLRVWFWGFGVWGWLFQQCHDLFRAVQVSDQPL